MKMMKEEASTLYGNTNNNDDYSTTMMMIQMMMKDYMRPIVLLICGMLLFNLPTVLYKGRLTLEGIIYFIISRDKSWKQPQDPGSIFGPYLNAGLDVEKKVIFFVRHGESTWNDTFNKGKHRSAAVFVIGFIPGLIKSILYELYLLLSGKVDSWFYDSPLSYLGISQVEELAQFLESKEIQEQTTTATATTTTTTTSTGDEAAAPKKTSKFTEEEEKFISILRADPGAPPSKIVCSNLRRAVSTLAIGFRDRLKRHSSTTTHHGSSSSGSSSSSSAPASNRNDKILILPSLQEISRNPDTLCITPAYATIQASWIEKSYKMANPPPPSKSQQKQPPSQQTSTDTMTTTNSTTTASSDSSVPFLQQIFNHQTDMSLHTGNKPLGLGSTSTNGLKRMTEFCDYTFSSQVKDYDYIIVGGHSIWFRSFFRTFLPYSVNHVSKTSKIVNAGVVAFTLMKIQTSKDGSAKYMIDPASIRTVYGGF